MKNYWTLLEVLQEWYALISLWAFTLTGTKDIDERVKTVYENIHDVYSAITTYLYLSLRDYILYELSVMLAFSAEHTSKHPVLADYLLGTGMYGYVHDIAKSSATLFSKEAIITAANLVYSNKKLWKNNWWSPVDKSGIVDVWAKVAKLMVEAKDDLTGAQMAKWITRLLNLHSYEHPVLGHSNKLFYNGNSDSLNEFIFNKRYNERELMVARIPTREIKELAKQVVALKYPDIERAVSNGMNFDMVIKNDPAYEVLANVAYNDVMFPIAKPTRYGRLHHDIPADEDMVKYANSYKPVEWGENGNEYSEGMATYMVDSEFGKRPAGMPIISLNVFTQKNLDKYYEDYRNRNSK